MKDPNILWLPHWVETRKSEHRSDAEWERIFRQGVRIRELRLRSQNIFRPDEEIPMYLRKQGGEDTEIVARLVSRG